MSFNGKLESALTKSDNIERNAVLWNAAGSVLNALQSMLLLLVITRVGNAEDASVYIMAFVLANLILNIGKYGVRQYQVTDISEKYSFREYVRARQAAILLMAAGTAALLVYSALFNHYTAGKSIVVLGACLTKVAEAYEDVYHGRLQQRGRLDIASRIYAIRMALLMLVFIIAYCCTKNLIFTTYITFLTTCGIALLMNRAVLSYCGEEKKEPEGRERSGVKGILTECFPVMLSMCLTIYTVNAPKYIIDGVVSDEAQTGFNIVFMVVFVINLLATFVFQPILRRFGDLWHEDAAKFLRVTALLTLVIAAVDAAVTGIGTLLGIPVLMLVYGMDLTEYKEMLVLLLLAGGVIAMQSLYTMILTVVRKQALMMGGYLAMAVLFLLSGRSVLASQGLGGLTGYYLVVETIFLVYLIVCSAVVIRRGKSRSAV